MTVDELINDKPGDDYKVVDGTEYNKGDKLKLILNKRRSDAADVFMNGKIATIETIYTDYDDKIYFAVTIDEDPGQDLMRQMKIYRFFLPDEVEKITL